MGKGDTYRPVDRKKWEESWERILKAKKKSPKDTKRD